jgi:hypothetical protein
VQVQTKLTVSQPSDPQEREADAIARQVVDGGEKMLANGPLLGAPFSPTTVQPMAQRMESSFPDDAATQLEDETLVQLKGEGAQSSTPVLQERPASGGGAALSPATQTRMGRSFGVNFEQVRIHVDRRAAELCRQLGAEAFTVENHIYFGAGKFDDRTREGNELLAHELAHTVQQTRVAPNAIQRRGGATVGDLSIRTNVVGGGLTDGHAWLSYLPAGGTETTYGTWGNRSPIGLHRDLEVGFSYAATRSTSLDSLDLSNLGTFSGANNSWGYINNCASFAARGWQAVAGESLSYKTFGIPNPSALGTGIVAANGGTSGVLPATTPPPAPGGGSSSSL